MCTQQNTTYPEKKKNEILSFTLTQMSLENNYVT